MHAGGEAIRLFRAYSWFGDDPVMLEGQSRGKQRLNNDDAGIHGSPAFWRDYFQHWFVGRKWASDC
jgi:hypothetical protein